MKEIQVEVLKHIGTIERSRDRVKVEIVRYNEGNPVINVQVEWQDRKTGEWKPGNRPAYDKDTFEQLLPLLLEAQKEL